MAEKRAPVFFTIAAIRHEPLFLLEKFFPTIQDELRRCGYSGPVISDGVQIQLTGHDGLSPHEQRFTVFNPERTSAFTLNSQGVFAYHTTAYTTRSDLFTQFRLGLDVLEGVARVQRVNRVGVRMLDLIRPSDSEHELTDFVQPGLLGFSGLKDPKQWVLGQGGTEQRFVDGDAEIIARIALFPDAFGVPSDVMPAISEHILDPGITSRPGKLHCILDMDSFTKTTAESKGIPFNADAVMAELVLHKNRISALFRSSVTTRALSVWGLA